MGCFSKPCVLPCCPQTAAFAGDSRRTQLIALLAGCASWCAAPKRDGRGSCALRNPSVVAMAIVDGGRPGSAIMCRTQL
jgi:hypothetical protein